MMKYLEFKIENYKGIIGPLIVKIDSKRSLIPLIGMNECGKTSVLKAILSFSYFNDSLSPSYKHLVDIENLYSLDVENYSPQISAKIELNKDEFVDILEESVAEFLLAYNDKKVDSAKKKERDIFSPEYWKKRKRDECIEIENLHVIDVVRKINDTLPKAPRYHGTYEIEECEWINLFLNPKLPSPLKTEVYKRIASNLAYHSPRILYFDDFQDNVANEIDITKNGYWQSVLNVLFSKTNKSYSLETFLEIDDSRKRDSVLDAVNAYLNSVLTEEWKKLRTDTDNADILIIELRYHERIGKDEDGQEIPEKIIETRVVENRRHFNVNDRSKGFYWFFNFVMKLEFNPSADRESKEGQEILYLLDEPGSYLHAAAQMKLCEKLQKLSETSCIIYATHSHYLLNPAYIPINNVQVVKKADNQILMESVYKYSEGKNRDTALQPLLDALDVPKYIDRIVEGQKILVAEGITEYYAFMLFSDVQEITILPAAGASKAKNLVPFLIGFGGDFRVLWDNDRTGNNALRDAQKDYGDDVARCHFRQLPKESNELEELITEEDWALIKNELQEVSHLDSDKKILLRDLFYFDRRGDIVEKVSQKTKDNFNAALKACFD